MTGEHRYLDAASSGIASAGEIARGVPRFAGWTLAAAEAMQAGPVEVAVVGTSGERDVLHREALRSSSPGAVVVAAEPGADIPLLEGRDLVDGKSAAYVCRHFLCQHPVTDPAELAVLLG